jgi:hypothetical protein
MYRKLADTIYLDFSVHLPTTGGVSDADALPTVEVFEDATDTTLAGATVTKRTGKTGNYRVAIAATTGNGFEVGKSYNVVVTAVAGGVTAKAVIGSFFIDSKRLADLNDLGGTAQTGDAFARLGAAGAGLTALGDARIANLDAAVSTRSTLTAQQVWEYATRTLSSFGTLVANVWANAMRTLTAGTRDSQIDAIKAKTDNLPAAPAIEGNVQGHVADALAIYDPPTKAEMDAVVSPLALEAGIEAHVLAVLNSYDPPTRAEATTDKAAILAAITALNDITVGEILNGDLSDSLSFPANSLADRLRKLFWILCNRMVIIDTSGAFTAYKGDGVTPGAAGTIVDNGTNTVRSAPTWP